MVEVKSAVSGGKIDYLINDLLVFEMLAYFIYIGS